MYTLVHPAKRFERILLLYIGVLLLCLSTLLNLYISPLTSIARASLCIFIGGSQYFFNLHQLLRVGSSESGSSQ